MTARPAPWRDPRDWQIAALATLLTAGVTCLQFDVTPPRIALLLGIALATQWACTRLAGLPRFDPRSALISALSLALLLRTQHTAIAIAAPMVAIASKFTIRVRGKHVFNPTNLALVLALPTGHAWVSPAQWGTTAFLAFAVVCMGGLVVARAGRVDVVVAFLGSYAALMFAGCAWAGQPPAVALHRLASGALLLFTFFMITDPRTTPDARIGRVLFSMLVALVAWLIPSQLHRTNGLLWALAACSPLVPLLDRVFKAPRHAWTPSRPGAPNQGDRHAPPVTLAPALRPDAGVARA